MHTTYKGYAIVCVGPTRYCVYAPGGKFLLATGIRSVAKAKAFINGWIREAEVVR